MEAPWPQKTDSSNLDVPFDVLEVEGYNASGSVNKELFVVIAG